MHWEGNGLVAVPSADGRNRVELRIGDVLTEIHTQEF
jgi:hypothetical protein